MLVFLVRAESVKGLNTEDADDSTEDICLFEINIDKLGGPIFYVLDSFANMSDLELGRKQDRPIKTISVWHCI